MANTLHPQRAAAVLGCVLILASVTAQAPRRHMPVFGVVRDTSGKPVPNVEVRVVRYQIEGLPSYQADQLDIPLVESNATRTDARGRFVLRLGGASRFGVVATSGTELRSVVAAPVAPGSEIELVLRRRLTMRGRVVNEIDGHSSAAVNFQVRCYPSGQSAIAAQPWPDVRMGRLDAACTDAKGEFALEILSGVSCRIEGDGLDDFNLETVDDPAFKILARKVLRVRGNVVDETTKKPVSEASLSIGRRLFRADRNGQFDILVPQSSKVVDVAAPGFAPLRHRFERAGRGDVALARSPMVRMRIVNGEGLPCRQHDMCVLQLASGPTGSGPVLTRCTTELDGTLRVPVGPKDFGFIVWARVANHWLRVCDAQPANRSLDLGDISIATYDLHGTVVDARGLPAANVPLFAGPTKPAFGSRMPLAQQPLAYTDHGGRFCIVGLPRRAFDVAARSPSSLTTFGPVVRGPTKAPLRLHLQPAQHIQGRVVDDAGKPVAGAIVAASAFRGAGERLRRLGLWSNATLTDAAGRFSVAAVVMDALHQLTAREIGWRGRSQEVPAEPGESDVVLTLPRTK